jgi:hypothetical protein
MPSMWTRRTRPLDEGSRRPPCVRLAGGVCACARPYGGSAFPPCDARLSRAPPAGAQNTPIRVKTLDPFARRLRRLGGGGAMTRDRARELGGRRRGSARRWAWGAAAPGRAKGQARMCPGGGCARRRCRCGRPGLRPSGGARPAGRYPGQRRLCWSTTRRARGSW